MPIIHSSMQISHPWHQPRVAEDAEATSYLLSSFFLLLPKCLCQGLVLVGGWNSSPESGFWIQNPAACIVSWSEVRSARPSLRCKSLCSKLGIFQFQIGRRAQFVHVYVPVEG